MVQKVVAEDAPKAVAAAQPYATWAETWVVVAFSWQEMGETWKNHNKIMGKLGKIRGKLMGKFIGKS